MAYKNTSDGGVNMIEFGNTATAAKVFGCCQKTVVRRLRTGEWPGYCSWTGRWLVNLKKVAELLETAAMPKINLSRPRTRY